MRLSKIECDALTFSVADGSVFIAAGFLERVVHGFQNIDHRDLIRRFGQTVSAGRAAHTFKEAGSAQLSEDLLKIGA